MISVGFGGKSKVCVLNLGHLLQQGPSRLLIKHTNKISFGAHLDWPLLIRRPHRGGRYPLFHLSPATGSLLLRKATTRFLQTPQSSSTLLLPSFGWGSRPSFLLRFSLYNSCCLVWRRGAPVQARTHKVVFLEPNGRLPCWKRRTESSVL